MYDPRADTQNFTISLTDANGVTGTVQADDPRYGLALHQTLGSTSVHVHVILQEIRVPLSDFAAQGVDLHNIRNLKLTFGDTSIAGMPASGSIQLANVRFQEAASGPTVFADTSSATGPAAQPALQGSDPADPYVALGLDPAPAAEPNGPDAAQVIDATPRTDPTPDLPDVVWLDGGGSASQARPPGGQPGRPHAVAATGAAGADRRTAARERGPDDQRSGEHRQAAEQREGRVQGALGDDHLTACGARAAVAEGHLQRERLRRSDDQDRPGDDRQACGSRPVPRRARLRPPDRTARVQRNARVLAGRARHAQLVGHRGAQAAPGPVLAVGARVDGRSDPIAGRAVALKLA